MKILTGLSQKILDQTFSKSSFLIGRMPGSEAYVLVDYIKKGIKGIKTRHLAKLHTNPGFYANNKHDQTLEAWCHLYLEALRSCDLFFTLGYRRFNCLIEQHYQNVYIWSCVNLHQWLPLLNGKRVLVISPFTDTIQKQHETKDFFKVFATKFPSFIYPQFELTTIKAPNTIKGNEPFPHNNWLESFEDLKAQTDKKEFDIAVIGCGGYGMPIAYHIKKTGRAAIHTGSYTQVMFGIKGNRWKDQGWFNDQWVFPSEKETPKSYKQVENGCYWKP